MASSILISGQPAASPESPSIQLENTEITFLSTSNAVFGGLPLSSEPSRSPSESVDMTASSSTVYASQSNQTIYQPIASTSKPPPSSFSMFGANNDSGSGSFDDDGSTTIAALDSPTPSPRSLPFSSPIPRTKKSDLLARRSNTPSLWLHEAILRNGLQASISAFSSPATSIRTSASLSNDNLSLGNSSGSDSEGASPNTNDQIQMMKILVDEATVLKKARLVAEEDRDKAVRERGIVQATLDRVRAERGHLRRDYEKLSKRLGERDRRYKTRKSQFHGARALHQQALKQVDAIRNVSVAWQNALDAEMALSKRLRSELKNKDEEIVRCTRLVEDLSEKLDVVLRERDSLASQCDALSNERESWLEERSAWTSERESLSNLWSAERDILSSERHVLMEAHCALSAEKDQLIQERDSLINERGAFSTERDSLIKERNAFSTERETLLNERESLQVLITQLIAEAKSSSLDLSIAKDKANLLTDQNSSLRDKNSALRLQVDRLETLVSTSKEEAKSYQDTVRQLERRKESLKKDVLELQEYEKEIIDAHNEEREKRRYWRGMFENEAKRCEELKDRFEEREHEMEKVINGLKDEVSDCRTQLALMEDWAGEMEDERRMLNDQIEAWKNGEAYDEFRFDVETYEEGQTFDDGDVVVDEAEFIEDAVVDENARDDGITPGDVKVAGDDSSSPVQEDMDLEGLDLEDLEERVIAVNEDGEIVDRDISSSSEEPSERPVDPSFSRLCEDFEADKSLWNSSYRKFERIPEYHKAMEDLRHQRAKLDDYRVKLLEWKDELKKEQARYDEISQDLFERERDFYATVDQRDHHMAKLADEYDRWRTECEFKEAEVEEERLAVWRHQRELERRVERLKEREKTCRKREGEVRWRMMCLDGALDDLEPGCWRCVPAPAHLFPPTPSIDYRDLDQHFEDLDEGQHESQTNWVEERNLRLRQEREERLKNDVDEEYLREGEDEPFEFSAPNAVQQYLREEKMHQKEMREDECVDEEKELEEWKRLKVENDKRVKEAVEELMKEADEVKRLERKEREKAECGDDGILGTYDETLAVNDGLFGMALQLVPEPVASTSTADNNLASSLPPLPSSPITGTSASTSRDVSSERALVDLVDPLSRRAFVDSLESTMRGSHMVDQSELTQRGVSEVEFAHQEVAQEGGVVFTRPSGNQARLSARMMEESIIDEGLLMAEEMTGAEDLSASWEDVSAD